MAEIGKWSANFDTDTLDQLLARVIHASRGVVSDEHRRHIMTVVRSLDHDEEKSISFNIDHEGECTSLGFTIFMDDMDAPDVAFFGPPTIIAIIESEHVKLCEELGL